MPMMFDWVTWGIWSVGFVILVVWIRVPLREFRRLRAGRTPDSRTPD
jgi:hypothetical protein